MRILCVASQEFLLKQKSKSTTVEIRLELRWKFPFHMLEVGTIFYKKINRLRLGALQICDCAFATIIEHNFDDMKVTNKYRTDEDLMAAINSSNQIHVDANVKEAIISTSHKRKLCMTQAYI